ncbi:MAG: hypothetical protein C4289_11585, partial [Chloroflexota bacterium]
DQQLGEHADRLAAGDDAAGLAVSEKLRAQVRGLNQAMRNAQDGISLIQTAEGALNETHSILQRMRELAVQAANDATLSSDDKSAIDKEMDELVAEIDKIASRTEFNGTKLLDGTFTSKTLQVGANASQTLTVSISSAAASALGTATSSLNGRWVGFKTVMYNNAQGNVVMQNWINDNDDKVTWKKVYEK